jgi:N-acetyl-gamma-glutamyl-phosphate reductase
VKPSVFIDGDAGTTGLKIKGLLTERVDISILTLSDSDRKNVKSRQDALNSCNLAILCLPDDAAREALTLIDNPNVNIIDTSTAHRINPGWVYGFPEMMPNQTNLIKNTQRVSNPGCYPTGTIALLRPLVEANLLPENYPLVVNAVSGYSGGGKSLIQRFEKTTQVPPAFYIYGTSLSHKHLPEMQKYIGLGSSPLFVPSVANYLQGMLVQVPIHLSSLTNPNIRSVDIQDILCRYYGDYTTIEVRDLKDSQLITELNPESLNNTNQMEINVFENKEQTHCLLVAVFDNLGKGASRAAIQSMELMLGLDETP